MISIISIWIKGGSGKRTKHSGLRWISVRQPGEFLSNTGCKSIYPRIWIYQLWQRQLGWMRYQIRRSLSWAPFRSFIMISNANLLFVCNSLCTSRFLNRHENLLVYEIKHLRYDVIGSRLWGNGLVNEVKKGSRNTSFDNKGSWFIYYLLHCIFLKQMLRLLLC